MREYRSEAAFSKAVCRHLRDKGYMVQRIETGSTGRGVPDIYCVSPDGVAIWLELKRVRINAKGRDRAVISWRPGQQAWLHQVTKYRQVARTLVAFNDCLYLISHSHIWSDNVILFSKCQKLTSLQDL